MSCQLTLVNELKQKNSWSNNLFQVRVKLLRPAKRKAIFFKNKISNLLGAKKRTTVEFGIDKYLISSGEMVRVRSKREIRSMLDTHEKYKGCLFIDEMYEHCDNTYRVLKTANYFFDEAKQKMCKAKDTLILEGVVCSGRQRLYSVSCDRNCFFFWHRDWLQRMEEGN